jgi:ATP-dependent protease ClpP protease subunit
MKNLRACLSTLALLLSSPTHADEADPPFFHLDSHPHIIFVSGEIDGRAALAFKKMVGKHLPTTVVLDSPGGYVEPALLIAEEVHERGMTTVVPAGSACLSACAMMFLAGRERYCEGALGVHQIFGDVELGGAQTLLSDVADLFERAKVPSSVFVKMLATPPADMYLFPPEELSTFCNFNSSAGRSSAAATADLGVSHKAGQGDTPVAAQDPSFDPHVIKRFVEQSLSE